MSVYSSKTTTTSILKSFSSADRERVKTAALNKVRFITPKEKGIVESVRVALDEQNFHLIQEFTYYLREADLCVSKAKYYGIILFTYAFCYRMRKSCRL